jgi:UDP-N-acetylglucosamine--N-acetylmuramyl-(pentapeptide) pyrophosphoryl-undecaprenol N-acetylglucosamine transferase
MLAKKADTILISFKDAKSRIENAKRIVYTGTPVKITKREYGINEKSKIINSLGLNASKPIVLVFGGSQGAQKINEAIIGILENRLNKKYQIMWATGPKQYDIIKNELNCKNIDIEKVENAKIVPYIYNMEEVMNISNIIVARSGAMTISEISNLGKPSILIPLPNVSQNHQLYNAKVLEKIDAAKIILNNKLTKENLNTAIEEIILDRNKMEQMSKNALKEATYNVEDKIYEEIKRLIKKEI